MSTMRAFREALDNAPAGIVDPRSWAYWNLRLGRYPAAPLPRRQLGGDAPAPYRSAGASIVVSTGPAPPVSVRRSDTGKAASFGLSGHAVLKQARPLSLGS